MVQNDYGRWLPTSANILRSADPHSQSTARLTFPWSRTCHCSSTRSSYSTVGSESTGSFTIRSSSTSGSCATRPRKVRWPLACSARGIDSRRSWLGFTRHGNRGSGLGRDFAVALHDNLYRIVSDFGSESVTKGSHLEKLCLIRERVGQDNISDFTTNLIKGYLCGYTQEFARRNLSREKRRVVSVPKVRFNYDTETWESDRFELPWT